MADRWFPGQVRNLPKGRFEFEVDRGIKSIYQLHYQLRDGAVTGPANTGFALAHGQKSVTGSAIGVPSGLSTLTNAGGSILGSTATNFTVSVVISTAVLGGVDIYVWMPTSNVDNTPIAATTAVTVSWWATGS